MDSIPNVHPLLVHFPIALLVVALLLDLVVIVGRKDKLACCSGLVLCLAALGAVAALVSGFMAEGTITSLSDAQVAHKTVQQHEQAAIATVILAAILAGWRLARRLELPPGWQKLVYLVVLVAAVTMVGLTGRLGGTLVYGHGLGVKPPAAEPSAP